METLNQQLMRELFDYRDGNLYRKVSTNCRLKIGSKVGSVDRKGYIHTSIYGKPYLVHRIIFLMEYGYLPHDVDHKDKNPSNNHIDNLRPATRTQNQYNGTRKRAKDNLKHVYWTPRLNKWVVRININGKMRHIGVFNNLELADLVATEARAKYHKEFACHE
jgi:hypothetical protein